MPPDLLRLLMRPACDAGVALARLDECIARSPVGAGWIERMHFADACASLWIDGELVHLEELVLHDATRDIRTPTHELTPATFFAPAGALPRNRRIGRCRLKAFGLCEKQRRSIRSALMRLGPLAPSSPRSRQMRKGRMSMTSKICLASILPTSMRCWPDRRRPSRTPHFPAAPAAVRRPAVPKRIR